MTDIKKALEDAMDNKIPVADTAFENETSLPFIVYLDSQTTDGDDFHVQTVERDLAVEFYAERIDNANETKLEALFKKNGWKYSKERTYLSDERCFETIYTMTIQERV